MFDRPPSDAGAAPPRMLHLVVRHVAQVLQGGGIDSPVEEARELVLMATRLDPISLVSEPQRWLDEAAITEIERFVVRRLSREPLTRIAGQREFYGRRFLLSGATLDPRPDTETLVEAVLGIVNDEGWGDRELRILDIGTGTGCLLITLLAELPHARGVGVDIADEAVATARANAERLGVGARAEFKVGDGPMTAPGLYDFVVSNPPYIPSAEIASLEPEVRVFDPIAALDGGADGLEFYRRWAPDACQLAPRGWVVFEVGAGQADLVAGILEDQQQEQRKRVARRWKDLGGHTRVVAFRTQS